MRPDTDSAGCERCRAVQHAAFFCPACPCSMSHLCLVPQIDPENEQLLQQHLTCAAAEVALVLDQDDAYFGPRVPDIAAHLQTVGAPPSPSMCPS